MSIVTLETHGTVALLTMNNGENRQDLAFANAMLSALQEAIVNKHHKALVLYSSDPKSWNQGIGINWLMQSMQIVHQKDMKKH